MKIDVNNGSIEFAKGSIRKMDSRTDFLASPLGREAKEELINEQWWHVTVKPESGVVATLIFHVDKLQKVFLSMEIPTDMTGDWTRELELERKSIHDSWLRRELGSPPYRYAWGSVASELDEKGVASEIIVAYGR